MAQKKRFQSLRNFRQPLLKRSAVPMQLTDLAAIKIQRFYRGYRGRKIYRDRSLYAFRLRYQKQFETLEGLQRFKFQQQGAALTIQRWFRSWKRVQRLVWHQKHRKMKEKFKRQKVLLRAIFKSKPYSFVQSDLDNRPKLHTAATIVMQRVIRGFLGRRRFRAFKIFVTNTNAMHRRAATKIQSVGRRYIAQVRHFPLGYRYRLYVRKVRRAVEAGDARSWQVTSAALAIELPENFEWMTRRQTYFFPSLRIQGLSDLDRMEDAALVIQCAVRQWLARKVYRVKFEQWKQVLATRLQKWAVKYLWRLKWKRAMESLRPFLSSILHRRRHRHKAATKMQSLLRGFVQRRRWLHLRSRRHASLLRIRRWLVYRYHLWKVHRALILARWKHDLHQAGTTCFERTRVRWYSYYLWQGIRKTRHIEKIDHELQRIYSSMSLTNGVELPKVFKMLRDCKGLLSGSFNANTIELQYTKIKQNGERRMEYPRFLEFVANVAVVRFLDIDPPKTVFEDPPPVASKPPAPGAGGPGGGTGDPTRDKILSFRFGALSGRAAFIAKFADVYLSSLPEYERAVEYLGRRSAREVAEAYIQQAIHHLQVFVRNRLFIKQTIERMRQRKQAKLDRRIYLASSKIQGMVKGFLSRRMITKMAQSLYSKYVDGETEREYWFNPRTQNSFWTKPVLLGKYDCGMAVRMPRESEQFSVMCANCSVVYATSYCETCDIPYCTACFATLHRSGQRKLHVPILIDHCIQCEFQIGTRFCNSCQDLFCDSCYRYLHRTGRLRFHAFERFASACDHCQDRAARWKEHGHVPVSSLDDGGGGGEVDWKVKSRKLKRQQARLREQGRNGEGKSLASSPVSSRGRSATKRSASQRFGTDSSPSLSTKDDLEEKSSRRSARGSTPTGTRYKIKLWCLVCYAQEHGGQAPQKREMSHDSSSSSQPTTALEPIAYYGRAVQKHLANKEIEKAQQLVEKSFQARKAVMEAKRRQQAALLLQRVYRGYHVRQQIRAFLLERRNLLVKRQEEDAIRHSIWYRLKASLGWNVVLESDTPLERVRKMYPWYMHHIVAACIESNWTFACRLLVEHEQHLQACRAKGKPTMMDYLRAELAVFRARRRFEKALKHAEERTAMVEASSATYYNAEASGAYGDAKLQKLKSGMNKLEKALQKDITKKQKAEEALDAAEQRVIDIIGPRGLQLLVDERRRTGVPLPFRVQMRKNSSLALVQYPLPTTSMSRKDGAETTDGRLEGSDYGTITEPGAGGGTTEAGESGRGTGMLYGVTLDQFVVGQNIPGQWKSRLKVGERVYIDQILFTVNPPLIAKKRRRSGSGRSSREGSASGRRRSRRMSSKDYSDVPSSDGDSDHSGSGQDKSGEKKSSQRRAVLQSADSFRSASEFSDYSDQSGRDLSSAPGSGTLTTPGGETAQTETEATDDHIQLDRPWLLDDAEQVEVFKVVPTVFYMQPIHALRRKLLRSYVTQKSVAVLAITNHKLAAMYSALSTMFDDDSDTYARLQRWNVRSLERRNAWLRLSYRKVDMSFDFTLRRTGGRMLWGAVRGVGSVVKMIASAIQVVNSASEETPYEYWQRSFEKEKIACHLDLGNDGVIQLGDIEMDLKAPCEIMREYIHRAFREKLNESIGESFLFAIVDEESNKTTLLPREDEYKTYSKDYAVQKVDARTFVSSLVVLMVKDKLRGRVFIPEFADKKDEDGNADQKDDADEEEGDEGA